MDLFTDATTTLASPTKLRIDPQGIAGDRMAAEHCIIVLGFCYNVRASAADVGFRLISRGDDNIERVHYRFLAVSSGNFIQTVSPLFMPIQPADYRNSPALHGYSLIVDKIGSPAAGSYFMAWGINTTMDFGKFYTGSPAIFPT